jgi:uncharacterized membrane protein
MEIILYLLKEFFTVYLIIGCVFTVLTAFIAFSTKTENDYTVGEIFAMLFIYPVIIYYLVYPERNDYER